MVILNLLILLMSQELRSHSELHGHVDRGDDVMLQMSGDWLVGGPGSPGANPLGG